MDWLDRWRHDQALDDWRDDNGWNYTWGLGYNPHIDWSGHHGGDYERA